MKSVVVVAALLLATACVALAAPATHPEQDYLAARHRYLEIFKQYEAAGRSDETVSKQHERALLDLEAQLQRIIGPLRSKGSVAEGKINLQSLSPGDEGFGMIDGLLFQSEQDKTRVFATTGTLLRARLDAHKSEPRDLARALKSQTFHYAMFDSSSAVIRFAEIPLVQSKNARLVVAIAVMRAQDIGGLAPNEIIISEVTAQRVFVASAPVEAKVPEIPACSKIWTSTFGARRSTDMAREDKTYAAFLRCFAAQAGRQRAFQALTKQAQAMLDRLPPR